MQSPLAALMGIADVATSLMQRVFSTGSGKTGFDEQLTAALSGEAQPGKASLAEALSTKGSIDEETMKTLLASPQAVMLLQSLSTLTAFGISSQDVQALLLGTGDKVSDEGLKAILTSCGITEGDLGRIMTDQKLVTNLKAMIAEAVSSQVHQQAPGDMEDMDLLIKQATVDQSTCDAAVTRFMATMADNGDSRVPESTQVPLKAIPAGIMEISPAIRKTIDACLKSDGMSAQKVVQDPSAVQAAAGTPPAIAESVEVLEKTFGISRNVLKDLFFSPDPTARQTALDETVSKVNAFLGANDGKQVPEQFASTLSLLKSALSKEEFAPIQKAVDLWQPGLVAAGTPLVVGKETLGALARTFGETPGHFFDRYSQQVVDQIRQAAPLQLKNSEGSITLELRPPMLGRVDVSLHMEDGAIQAVFRTDQSLTRDILQQNMHLLKEAFADQGIRVTQVSVSTDLMNQRNSSDASAWAGSDRGNHGFSGQGRGRGTGDTDKGHEEYRYSPANGYTMSGGLDIFA